MAATRRPSNKLDMRVIPLFGSIRIRARLELLYLDRAARESRGDIELAAERLDDPAQCGGLHVPLLFQFRSAVIGAPRALRPDERLRPVMWGATDDRFFGIVFGLLAFHGFNISKRYSQRQPAVRSGGGIEIRFQRREKDLFFSPFHDFAPRIEETLPDQLVPQ
jgi:hypothetical protein